MANKVLEMLKSDGTEAAYRVGATQITKAVKAALLKVFEAKGGDSGQMEMFKMLLDSEVGDALVSVLLGHVLPRVPGAGTDRRVEKLAVEMRTNGMAIGGNLLADMAMGSILPVLTEALKNLPEETDSNVRVSHEEEEDDEDAAPVKKIASRG